MPIVINADYVIYPIPQNAQFGIDGNDMVTIGKSVNIVAEKGIDIYTKNRAEEIFEENDIKVVFSEKPSSKVPNIFLGIKGSKDFVDKYVTKLQIKSTVFDTKGKYDRHMIVVRNNAKHKPEIVVLGEHTNAVYYGLATIEQILEQSKFDAKNNSFDISSLKIDDYADMQYRGIVEGYYGYPYSFAVKKELIKFFKKFKLNTYLYGAKSDPFHSGYWRKPYPTEISKLQEKNGWLSQQMIKDLTDFSIESKVNFIWAIHPNSGNAVDFHTTESTDKAVSDVMGKFELMHGLGIRQFAVFLDDAGWDFADVNNYRDFLTNLQNKLFDKYNRKYENATDTVLPIHYVPHIYAINFAKEEDLKTYFDAISQTSSNIVVYTTGSGVWSSIKQEDFSTMQNLMQRPVALWWNYPCNDNKDGRVYTADMYSTLKEMGLPIPDKSVPSCLGIVSNPMQQGMVSEICLFGVADYSWNTSAFDTQANWEASFPSIVGSRNASLYRFLAPYLRYEDPKDFRDLLNQYLSKSDSQNKTLIKEKLNLLLTEIKDSTSKMLNMDPVDQSFDLLRRDLAPWLCKLNVMSDIGRSILNLDNIANENDRWQTYCNIVKTVESFKTDSIYMVDALEGMGENPPSVLHPVEPCGHYFLPFIEEQIQNYYKFNNSSSPKGETMSNRTSNIVVSQNAISDNDGVFYVENQTPLVVQAKECVLITLPKGGKPQKVCIAKSLLKQYDIDYSFYGRTFKKIVSTEHVAGKDLKYIRLTNKSSKKQLLKLNKDMLSIYMPYSPMINSVSLPNGQVYGNHGAKMLVDGDYNTFACLGRDQADGDSYVVELNQEQPIYDVNIAFGTTNLDFPKVGIVQISKDGVNWKNLKIKGTDDEIFRMTLPQVKKLNEDVSICSFVNDGSTALYVRFYLKETFQEKWLRLNEIEINPSYLASQYAPVASVDGQYIPELVDGKANTIYSPDCNDAVIKYNLFGSTLPKNIIVYVVADNNERPSCNASVKVICNEQPYDVCLLKKGINQIDLAKYPDATSVLINIKDKSCSIAEIVEQ